MWRLHPTERKKTLLPKLPSGCGMAVLLSSEYGGKRQQTLTCAVENDCKDAPVFLKKKKDMDRETSKKRGAELNSARHLPSRFFVFQQCATG